MPKSENQKRKLLVLLKLLYEQSDELHPLSMKMILESLEKENITAERKSPQECDGEKEHCGPLLSGGCNQGRL